jgi:hypothetical protein
VAFSAPRIVQRTSGCACGGGCPRCGGSASRSSYTVNTPGDRFEQEADRVAEQVMRMSDSDAAPPPGSDALPRSGLRPSIQRACAACGKSRADDEGQEIQAKEDGGEPRVSSDLQGRIDALRGGGEPLPAAVRSYFEPRFGHDFSRVRVHADARAADTARAVQAQAYTIGGDIVFGPGRYAPESDAGKRLLAHELVHTIQQGASTPAGGGRGTIGRISRKGLMQRAPDIRELPPGMSCVTVTDPGHPAGTTVRFSSGTTLASGEDAHVTTFHSTWTAAGGTDDISVDGFASTDGAQGTNWQISCDRAEEVKTRLVALGVPATKITTFAHGESAAFSAGSAAANRVAVMHTGNRLAPSDLTIDRVEGRGPADSIFFERGQSTIPAGAQANKIAALAVPAGQDLTLSGFVSEDEDVPAGSGMALATARINAVSTALSTNAPPHTGAHTPDTATALTAGQGNLNYRSMRKVVVKPTGVSSGVSNCAGSNGLIACSPTSQFTTAQSRADTLLQAAVAAVSPANVAANAGNIDTAFHTTSANRTNIAARVLTNLTNLRPHISTQMTPVSTLGPGPAFTPGPGHRCANDCDAVCGGGATAYNNRHDANAVMTLCDTPRGFMRETDLDQRALTLIHEGLHGTALEVAPPASPNPTVPGSRDFSYEHQRLILFLDANTAIKNSDSYVVFVRLINSIAGTMGRATPDVATGVAMTASQRRDVDRALAFLEGWLVLSRQEVSSLYGTIVRSIAGGSWDNTYYEATMELLAPRFGLTRPPSLPTATDQRAVAAIHERLARMRAVLYTTTALTIDRIAVGATSWSSGPGSTVTIGPDFFSIPAGAGHDRAQLDLLLRRIVEATTGVTPDAVSRYVDLVNQIRIHLGIGAP